MSPAGVSQVIDTLEERGLVARERSTTDRRSLQVVPGDAIGPIDEELTTADAAFFRLAEQVSPEGLDGFVHIMRGLRDLSASKFQTA